MRIFQHETIEQRAAANKRKLLVSSCHILAATCFLLGAVASAQAQTSGPFELNWPHPGEKLVYQSRGCADECREATVVNKRTGVLLARLSCDGTDLPLALHGYRPAAAPSRVDLGDCSPDS
ncbi:hypothetical protein [Burkholderia sp. SIMBA_062]|uniref:hypothetical protein n=1 Tax=Burkholderia sp. SIMBA_062 TaxID=3085803 RepID=UPI00397E4C8D